MNKFKKLSMAMALIVGFSFSQSKAAVGAVIKEPTAMTIGAAFALGGNIGVMGGLAYSMFYPSLEPILMASLPYSFGYIIAGVIILEDGNAVNLNYTALNQDQAKKLGLTAQQMNSYNENVELFNGIKDQIATDVTKNTTVEEASSQWKNALNEFNVSPEAVVGLAKVSQQLFKISK